MAKGQVKTEPTHTGKLGEHPVGGAVGAAVGAAAGAAATGVSGVAGGASIGAALGPLGVVAGMGIGGVAGALAGKAIAQVANPTTEDAYWNDHYSSRPYVTPGEPYDVYRPAYRHGVDAYNKYRGKSFDEIEPDLNKEWDARNGTLPWTQAKPASRDAYERLNSLNANDNER